MEWIYGNGIAEIGWKKNLPIGLWQCHCQNKGVKKKILGNCGNPIAENGKGKKKKKAVFEIQLM